MPASVFLRELHGILQVAEYQKVGAGLWIRVGKRISSSGTKD